MKKPGVFEGQQQGGRNEKEKRRRRRRRRRQRITQNDQREDDGSGNVGHSVGKRRLLMFVPLFGETKIKVCV